MLKGRFFFAFPKVWVLIVVLLFPFFSHSATTDKNTASLSKPLRSLAACLPDRDLCSHKAGRLWFTATNYGILGSQLDPTLRDCITGLTVPSAQFPGGSNIEHLFGGAPWVGAIVNGDTLVSIGTDGWLYDQFRGELHADCDVVGDIVRRSTNLSSPYYSPNALSEMDFIATMFDTLTDPQFVENPDPNDGKPFKPMGLKIVQTSLSYTGTSLEDIIFIHYKLENIQQDTLKNTYFGIFWDGDIGHLSTTSFAQDDWSGLFQADTVIDGYPLHLEIPYVVDNDGDPGAGTFTPTSPTSAIGLYLLRTSVPFTKTSFNWWTPNATVALDWGPQKAPGRLNQSGGHGQPEGDAMKYYYLSNGEKDYPQIKSAIDYSAEGWLPPLVGYGNPAIDIANGFDARYLYSIGPFELAPAETVSFAMALLAGTGFHRDPQNFIQLASNPANFVDTAKVAAYERGLDFSDLISKALAARQKLGIVPARGDINGDGLLSIADVVTLLNIIFLNNPPPTLALHDLNCDGDISAADLVLLINFVFMGNPQPC